MYRDLYQKKRKLNYRRVALAILILIFIILFFIFIIKLIKNNLEKKDQLFISNNYKNNDEIKINNNYEEVILENKPQEDISININVAGDIITHNSNFKDAYDAREDEYDFSYVFDNIADYFERADFNIGTLESNFAGKSYGYSNYPTFNAPEHLAVDLKELGFDM